VLHFHQVHSLKQFLVFWHKPLNKQYHEANSNQDCHFFGLLRLIANPPLKRMGFQQDNRYGDLVVPLGPLDIIVVIHF
jgi:hypothetical protein